MARLHVINFTLAFSIAFQTQRKRYTHILLCHIMGEMDMEEIATIEVLLQPSDTMLHYILLVLNSHAIDEVCQTSNISHHLDTLQNLCITGAIPYTSVNILRD